MNDDQKKLVQLLKTAVNSVYKEDRFLFAYFDGSRKGMEQSFVFRTGIYLNDLMKDTEFKSLDLDSEYNKNLNEVKATSRYPDGIRPDLIIHERGSNNQNKLAVEFKGFWKRNIQKDINKLEDLTNPNGKYKYTIGIFVFIGEKNASYRYIINGAEHVEGN